MKLFSILFHASIVIGMSATPSTALNVAEDAWEQSSRLHRCWELEGGENPTNYVLSEPIYQFCQYVPTSDFGAFLVSGAEEAMDDFEEIKALFNLGSKTNHILTVCLQEALQFHERERSSQISHRCYCARDGCNVPKTYTNFLTANRNFLSQNAQ